MNLLSLYVVKNSDGKYFCKNSSYSWVSSLSQAKIYPKIGQARSRCTFFALSAPDRPAPQIVELRVTEAVVLDESKRIEKAKRLSEKRTQEIKKRREEFAAESLWRQMEQAKSQLTGMGYSV